MASAGPCFCFLKSHFGCAYLLCLRCLSSTWREMAAILISPPPPGQAWSLFFLLTSLPLHICALRKWRDSRSILWSEWSPYSGVSCQCDSLHMWVLQTHVSRTELLLSNPTPHHPCHPLFPSLPRHQTWLTVVFFWYSTSGLLGYFVGSIYRVYPECIYSHPSLGMPWCQLSVSLGPPVLLLVPVLVAATVVSMTSDCGASQFRPTAGSLLCSEEKPKSICALPGCLCPAVCLSVCPHLLSLLFLHSAPGPPCCLGDTLTPYLFLCPLDFRPSASSAHTASSFLLLVFSHCSFINAALCQSLFLSFSCFSALLHFSNVRYHLLMYYKIFFLEPIGDLYIINFKRLVVSISLA